MVRNRDRPRIPSDTTSRQNQRQMANLLDDSASSATSHDSAARQTRNSARNSARVRDPTPVAPQAKPTGAAKRKPKKPMPRLALNQIRHFQTTTENLIPKAPFCRCLKEVLHFLGDYRISKEGIDALQVAVESYIVGIFNDAYCLTIHRKRVTIDPSDISLLLYIRGGTSQFH